jgi:hypothetical protein
MAEVIVRQLFDSLPPYFVMPLPWDKIGYVLLRGSHQRPSASFARHVRGQPQIENGHSEFVRPQTSILGIPI